MPAFRFRLALLAAFAGLACAAPVWAEDKPNNDKLGTKIGNFTLKDSTGKTFTLHDLKEPKGVVIVFLNFECPVASSYGQTLAELHKTFSAKDVTFIGVCPCEDMDEATIAKHAAEMKLPFPVYRDAKREAVDAVKAGVTPEAFVLDHNFYLRYRGRIDNGYSDRFKRNVHITEHDLRNALDQQLAGKTIATPITVAVGCPISVEKKIEKDGKVTYYRDVLPILQNNCQVCHRPGEVGPFALMTYKQAVNWADDIRDYTASRKMPPWKPSEGLAFHNERTLSEKDIATLAAWVKSGTPEGDAKDAPAEKKFTDGWQLGKPDLVLSMDDDFQLGASGADHFRWIVLPTGLTEDKYVTAVEVRAGNARILHHALLFIDTTGGARKLEKEEKERVKKDDEIDLGPGYPGNMIGGRRGNGGGGGRGGFIPQSGLRGWAPGQVPQYTPEGTAFFLPKNSDVVMQMHYHRNGRLEKDRTQIGLYFAKKDDKPQKFQAMVAAGVSLFIQPVPANAENHKVTGAMWATNDVVLHEITPHMHMIGKKIKLTMTPPGGKTETLIGIDDWDYNWQETYVLKSAIKVKAGTRFDVEAVYDNSIKNPNNPSNPPKEVRFGEQTTNEMCFVFLGITTEASGAVHQSFLPIKPAETKPEEKKPDEKKPGETRKP